jgi:hypothetical protein
MTSLSSSRKLLGLFRCADSTALALNGKTSLTHKPACHVVATLDFRTMNKSNMELKAALFGSVHKMDYFEL